MSRLGYTSRSVCVKSHRWSKLSCVSTEPVKAAEVWVGLLMQQCRTHPCLDKHWASGVPSNELNRASEFRMRPDVCQKSVEATPSFNSYWLRHFSRSNIFVIVLMRSISATENTCRHFIRYITLLWNLCHCASNKLTYLQTLMLDLFLTGKKIRLSVGPIGSSSSARRRMHYVDLSSGLNMEHVIKVQLSP